MSLRHKRPIRRVVLLVTYVSLACQFLIPVGYMPAALSEGWPVRMCHTGLPDGFLYHADEHAGHNNESDPGWESCSLGVMSSAVPIVSDHTLHVPYFGEALTPVDSATLSIGTTVVVFRSRAPPA